MTQDEFINNLDRYKAVIPDVYNRVKDQSDTFFINQALGPNYNTQNVRISEESPKFTHLKPKLEELQLMQSRSKSPKYGSGYDMYQELGENAPHQVFDNNQDSLA